MKVITELEKVQTKVHILPVRRHCPKRNKDMVSGLAIT